MQVWSAQQGTTHRQHACGMQVGPGDAEGTDVGPVITSDSKARIEALIASAEQEGARVVLDGRGVQVPGHAHGAPRRCMPAFRALLAKWFTLSCSICFVLPYQSRLQTSDQVGQAALATCS